MTTKLYFDLYGCKLNDIDLVRKYLEDALGIQMEGRDSFYFGRYFRFRHGYGSDNPVEIECQGNWNYEEGALYENNYPAYPIVIYINGTLRPDEFEEKLKASNIQFDLLERELL